MDPHKRADALATVIARAWHDPDYKKKLKADPAAALKKAGITVPKGLSVKLVQDTDKVKHLVLPPKPSTDDKSHLERHANAHVMKIITCCI